MPSDCSIYKIRNFRSHLYFSGSSSPFNLSWVILYNSVGCVFLDSLCCSGEVKAFAFFHRLYVRTSHLSGMAFPSRILFYVLIASMNQNAIDWRMQWNCSWMKCKERESLFIAILSPRGIYRILVQGQTHEQQYILLLYNGQTMYMYATREMQVFLSVAAIKNICLRL